MICQSAMVSGVPPADQPNLRPKKTAGLQKFTAEFAENAEKEKFK
jgi:hypothetical protein